MSSLEDISAAALAQMIARAGKNLSREFSSPLKQLILPLEKLLEEENDPLKSEQMQLALHSAYRFHSLVTVLEEIADLEMGETSFIFHESDVVKFTQSLVDSFKQVALNRKITLQFHSSEPEIRCYYDFAKLRRVIYTLLANAIRYSDKELSSISISLQPIKNSNMLRLNVTDDGIGIVAEKIPFLTNPFYEDPLHLQLYQSTSLGLYLVKRLLELLGGSLNYFSEKGSGTTVEVQFPVFKDAAAIPFQKFSIDHEIAPELVQLSEIIKEVDTYEIVNHQPEKSKHLPQILVLQQTTQLNAQLLQLLRQHFRVIVASKTSKLMQLAMEHQPDLILVAAEWNANIKSMIEFLKQSALTAHIPLFWMAMAIQARERQEAAQYWVDGICEFAQDQAFILAELKKVLKNRELAYAYSAQKSIHEISKPSQSLSMDESFLQRLHFVIEKNLHEASPDLQAYCEMMNYSRAQLHRKIKRITGMSTSIYIRNHKLKLALNDLQHGRANVSEISYKYGFGSLAYFSRLFKSRFGLSPSQVRSHTLA